MVRIGVLGASNIAERRMIPAIIKQSEYSYVGTAISTCDEMGVSEEEYDELKIKKNERAKLFKESFGGNIYSSYEALILDKEVDAIYIALPPALHFKWALKALHNGKHIILEKPFTTSLDDTNKLISEAQNNNLAVIENYGFVYHKQMQFIKSQLSQNEIGDIRLVRASFGFPHRDESDFRYNKALGGGALLDCGGYTIKAATSILGNNVDVMSKNLVITEGHTVDIFGSATLKNSKGICAQIAFGMDNYYKCELEIWGEKGYISAPRIFTAPDGFDAPVIVMNHNGNNTYSMADNQFIGVLSHFIDCINISDTRKDIYNEIITQSNLVNKVLA